MHNEEWSGSRVAAVLARLEDAGYSQSRISRISRIGQATISRWSRGENRPSYDGARRLAVAIWRQHPDLAQEMMEASGYPWQEPADAPSEPLVAPELADSLRRSLDEDAEWVIAELERRRAERRAGQPAAQEPPEPREGQAAS
jgi:transcriptional regulator with XRE-family HTH domain